MSYAAEEKAITNYLQAQSFFGLSPFGLDGDALNVVPGSGFMKIISGEGRQTTTGAPGANCHDYVGVLSITFFTQGKDKASRLTFTDAVVEGLTGLKIDETSAAPSAGSTVVIDFGRNGFVPYVSESRAEAPHHRTVIFAPFIRTERK